MRMTCHSYVLFASVELRESSDQSDLLPDQLKRHNHVATIAILKFSLAEPYGNVLVLQVLGIRSYRVSERVSSSPGWGLNCSKSVTQI
jgi:hypothetical protein